MHDHFDAQIPQKHFLTFIECDKSMELSLHQWMKYALMVFLATLMEYLQSHSDEWAKFSIRHHVSSSTASLHLWSEKFMTTDGRRYTSYVLNQRLVCTLTFGTYAKVRNWYEIFEYRAVYNVQAFNSQHEAQRRRQSEINKLLTLWNVAWRSFVSILWLNKSTFRSRIRHKYMSNLLECILDHI